MSRITLEAIHGGETRSQVFDFSSQCAVGETLSTATVTAVVYSGTDPAPTVISGAATISGQKITQLLAGSGGVSGAVYIITAIVTTSTSQILRLIAYLSIIPATQ